VKLVFLDKEQDGLYVIGREHEMGRIERLWVMDRTQANERIGRRIVWCFNACTKLSDATLKAMAEGSTAGDLAERVVAWSLFMYNARPTAIRILAKAREKIFKDGGQA
jgi:hypothetical protein